MLDKRATRLVLFAATVGAAAMSLPSPAAAATTYVVGVEDINYLPLYNTVNGQYTGVFRQILDRFAADQGIKVTYLTLPVSRLDRRFVEGQMDLHFPDNPDWITDLKRNVKVTYSQPVINYIDGTLVPRDQLGKGVDRIQTIGTVLGFTPWAWEGRLKSGKAQLATNSDFLSLVQMVLANRLDAAYAGVAMANYQLDQVLHKPGALVFDPSLPYQRSAYLLSTTNHPELIAAFNKWMAGHQSMLRDLKQKSGAEEGVTTAAK
ncbi:MAG TPA: transporter substrate-binding domain-containing protein [Stellaceae bacterium]|nr:transporter substrate-binding domain-containing protein [Stellaceae bacterium]